MPMPRPALLGLCALLGPTLAGGDWSATSMGYRYGTQFREPGIQAAITKNTFTFTHANGYSLGENFFTVDLLRSDANDPSNGAGSEGAQEVYAVYRHDLSLGKLFRTSLQAGPIRDVAFTAGFDYSAKNTEFAPAVRKILLGPTLAFAVPKGFVKLGLLYYKEKNHNSFGTGSDKNVSFDPTYQVALAWGLPVDLGPVATSFQGFGTYTGAKGKDGNLKDTEPETLVRMAWLFDVGAAAGKKGTWLVGPGYEYWKNKFGNASPIPPPFGLPNPNTSCVTLNLEIRF
ncbi:MAG TPA: hypothetical protein VJ623_03200 [Holophagaceae bacterium]|nr:hypothetical protein [Holophagaceae bacterium]